MLEDACIRIGIEEEHCRRIINTHSNMRTTGEKKAKIGDVCSVFGVEEDKLLNFASVLIQV
jgi:hypothetical protein